MEPANHNHISFTTSAIPTMPAHIAPEYPYISGLRKIGMEALISNGKIGLTPGAKVTPEIINFAKAHNSEIVAEMLKLQSLFGSNVETPELAESAESTNSKSTATTSNINRWQDPNHDMDKIEAILIAMFAECNRLNWKASQYWDGISEPKPSRPYCYVRSEWLQQASTLKTEYLYIPMIANIDGNDYWWAV